MRIISYGRHAAAADGQRRAMQVHVVFAELVTSAVQQPLINRDDLEDAIYLAFNLRVNTADAVIAYLREVLTPEALDTDDPDLYLTGTDLHRRIFGDT